MRAPLMVVPVVVVIVPLTLGGTLVIRMRARSADRRGHSGHCRAASAGVHVASPSHLLVGRNRNGSAERGRQPKMFTARETTTATVTSDARDCSIINNLAHAVRGIVSVGLKAVAFVNDV